jgi:hypothetical protein
MKKIILSGLFLAYLFLPSPVLAASPEITAYTNDTLSIITLISTAAAVFFLIRGGYLYLTSTGNPQALDQAKKTIKQALIGLVIVLAAGVITSVFRNAVNSGTADGGATSLQLAQIESVKPSDGLTQVLIDAVASFMQNIIESATKPIVDGVLGYLTTTPSLLNNSVIVKFWLISLGIVDSLFVLAVALLGLHFMSASSLGFEEVELKQLLPKIGIAFLGANISLFLADYAIITCNTLVKAVLDSTGGLNHAWVVNAINPTTLINGTTPLITLIFLALFLIVAIVLLLMYISRLIMISLGAVLSPFIFLIWTLPKFADTAEMAVKTYLVSVFMIFIHTVVIQLAGSFLALPESNENSLISIAIAIGLFLTLLKVPSLMMQAVLYTSRSGALKKIGGQIINVISADNSSSATRAAAATTSTPGTAEVKTKRKVVQA